MSELLLGCGTNRDKRITVEGTQEGWTALTTLDWNPEVKPDVEHDMNKVPWPFDMNTFDEIHAYEVLEHIGTQGDWRAFFMHFGEAWRILKPGGYLCLSVPMWDSPWAWADPGHTRIITKESLWFLDRRNYEQLGKTAMTDYRNVWTGDFHLIAVEEGEHQMGCVLRAVK